MQRLTRVHTGLIVLVIVAILLAACGGSATPDPGAVSAAVEATLTALPLLEPQATDVPSPTDTPIVTPDLRSLIPPRRDDYQHSYEITREFDRFSGETVVTLKPDVAEAVRNPHGSLAVIFHYKGTTATLPHLIILDLMSSHAEWQFLRCHDLTLLLDGKPLSLETHHEGSVIRGGVMEQVMSTPTLQEFLEIVNAKKVEGKVCNTEFELTPAQMEALRDVASRMQP